MELLATSVDLGSGDGFIHQLLMLLIIGICVGIIYAMGWWFFRRPGLPPMAMMIWNGIFILIGGIVIINFLLSLGGHGFVRW